MTRLLQSLKEHLGLCLHWQREMYWSQVEHLSITPP